MDVTVGGVVWPSELPVGADLRVRSGQAVRPALWLVTVFAIVTIGAKQWPTLYAAQPWQDDPCDVAVSFDFAVLPALLALAAARLLLCRAAAPLPMSRLVGVVRVSLAAVAACLVSIGMEWAQTLAGQHREAWDLLSGAQVVGLAAFTALTVPAWKRLLRVSREAEKAGTDAGQPDWLADACCLAQLGLTRFLPGLSWPQALLGWVETVPAAAIRRHPAGSAAMVALLLSTPFVTTKVYREHYAAPMVALSALVSLAALYAAAFGIGAYLRIVNIPSGAVPRGAVVAAAGCAGGVAVFSVHDLVLPEQTMTGILALFGFGITAGAITALTVQHYQTHRPSC